MTVTAEIPRLTPEQLAECFWEMDDSEQGRFFGSLGACALASPEPFSKKPGSYFGLDMQMHYTKKHCTPNGLRVMEIIGQTSSVDRLQPYLENFQSMPPVPVKQGNKL